ncbi:MAG TPA: Crp/Fnr family transcriptional regulator [Roseiflexaceae bacterium]|nr:Crp/Fnr family transcriptional regulator [Roseiflexaceae bacterium]
MSEEAIPPVETFADYDLLADLPGPDREELVRLVSVAEYPAGYTFYAPEDAGERVYLLRRGRVRLYKLSPEGRALTLMLLEPPAIFGELALAEGGRHDSFAEAMTDCTVGLLGREALRRVLGRNPSLALRLMGVMSRRLRAMERKLADIAFKSVPQRLATVLLSLAGEQADGRLGAPLVVVRYTHQQLAEMIGSYRETVTKVIGEFREAGIIRVEEDAILLTDLGRLRALVSGHG